MKLENYYDKNYYKYQKKIGIFGAKANKIKFDKLIKNGQRVLDFGCGGGFLLNEYYNIEKFGVEINEKARDDAEKDGIKCFDSSKKLPDNFFDLIISNHALEHCKNPFEEIQELYRSLKKNGKICLVVPLDSYKYKFKKDDINFHLYSWSPMNLGNILKANNFEVISSEPFMHKWFPGYYQVKKFISWKLFHNLCFLYGRINKKSSQIRAIAIKK